MTRTAAPAHRLSDDAILGIVRRAVIGAIRERATELAELYEGTMRPDRALACRMVDVDHVSRDLRGVRVALGMAGLDKAEAEELVEALLDAAKARVLDGRGEILDTGFAGSRYLAW